MKRFKKLIIIITIAILVTLISAYVIKANSTYNYSNTDRNKIIAYDLTEYEFSFWDNVVLDEEVTVIQNPNETGNPLFTESETGRMQLSILNQPNVWCVEKGVDLDKATYKVTAKHITRDPALAYILAGPQMGELREGYPDKYQIALWFYLKENNGKDAISGEEISTNVSADLSSYEGGEGYEFYQEALAHREKVNNFSIEMSEITINGTDATFTVTGDYDEDNLVVKLQGTEIDSYTNEDGKFTVDISGINDSNIQISVESKMTTYEARYRVLKNAEEQRLIVATDIREKDITDSDNKSITIETEISLQKYITHVNGELLSSLPDDVTTLKDRKNLMTKENDEEKVKEKISSKPEINEVTSEQYKKGGEEGENAVNINKDDEVTYKIEVYNNSDTDATNVKVRDCLPLELEEGKFEIVSIYKDGDTSNDIKGEWVDDGDFLTSNTYQYIISSLPAGTSTYFDVTVKFYEYAEDILVNSAWIYEADQENITDTYRTLDRDYVKMNNPFKVSLEKYISAVNGVAPTGDDAGREGKAEYLTVKDDGTYVNETENDTVWTQHNTYKQDHIVTVSKGDIVTYTIKVTNDGRSQVYVSEITDWFPNGVKYGENEYIGEFTEDKLDTNKVIFTNLSGNLLEPGESASFTVDVEVIEENDSTRVLKNTAKITMIKDKAENAIPVRADDNDTTPFDNEDSDYIDLNFATPPPVEETTSYSVEKIWADNNDRKGLRPDKITVELHRLGEGRFESVDLSDSNNWRHEWPELVKYDGNGNEYQYFVKEISEVQNYTTTYTTTGNKTIIKNTYYEVDTPPVQETIDITVQKYWKNDSVTTRPASIKVQLYQNGVALQGYEEQLDTTNGWSCTWTVDKSYTYTVKEVEVPTGYTVEYNGYSIYNTYNTTPLDPDIPITPDIPDIDYSVISGFVWNDIAQNKIQNNYDGKYQTLGVDTIAKEKPIEGVKVMLYRYGKGKILEDFTDSNGKYSFNDADLTTNMLLVDELAGEDGRYIKGPKHCHRDPDTGELVTTTWTGEYYSYYVIFEYDGVTYTSTKYNSFTSSSNIDSNAKEDNNILELATVVKSRDIFNNNFNIINNGSGINYDTVNENGYIPQSRHNAYTTDLLGNKILLDKYQMQSSTDLINMATASEDRLDHVNLGLRGRDIFDLELTSDVVEIDVNINNQPGVYKNTNRVNLRNSDIKLYEDMANIEQEESNDYDAEHNQYIRESDKNALGEILGEITVTYKITVFNASPTPGKATKITNYYDDSYEVIAVYSGSTDLGYTPENSGSGYNSIEITTPGTILKQSEKMEIYVVYSLKDSARHDIGTLSANERYITYNMSEITEYTADAGGDKYTRGLIDKDSAPGSANKEQVRTTDTEDQNTPTSGGNPTTVGYYFGGNDLSKLKYEDDTYATPVVYTISDSRRTITGIVFEDATTVDSGTKIKTGNGKLDTDAEGNRIEVGVYGATVELIEQGGSNSHYVTDSNENGYFSFSGFLPGNYVIKYSYGDTEKTVLLGQYDEDTNKESYNGEDYQSTNNTGKMGGTEAAWLNKLSDLSNFWYVFNEKEGISTATDDEGRRNQVSANVLSFEPADIQKLNSIRELIGEYSDSNNGTLTANKKWNAEKNTIIDIGSTTISGINDIRDNTSMFATTKPMLISVEETVDLRTLDEETKKLTVETDPTNKLGQWCIFPGSHEQYQDYTIENMNFGIAKVPVTTVDLDKYISGFTITDSTGNNVISSLSLVTNADGTTSWKLTGDSLYIPAGEIENAESKYDVSIEDEKLQGARLEITYTISQRINKEVNFNGDSVTSSATIKGIVDFVDNNLIYNPELGNNKIYWDIITYNDLQTKRNKLVEIYTSLGKTVSEADIDIPDETEHTTILELKESSGFYNLAGGTNTATITLEKVLSSTNSTIDGLLSEVLDDSGYSNEIRITGWEYTDTTDGIDRIRTEEGYIILPGLDHDYSKSEILVIHPPTGSNFNILYLAIAVISLVILAAGVFGIKKFVIKK